MIRKTGYIVLILLVLNMALIGCGRSATATNQVESITAEQIPMDSGKDPILLTDANEIAQITEILEEAVEHTIPGQANLSVAINMILHIAYADGSKEQLLCFHSSYGGIYYKDTVSKVYYKLTAQQVASLKLILGLE